MTPDPLETRALRVLHHYHPSTDRDDRWRGWGVDRKTLLAKRDLLLAWAATLSDETMLEWRNIGTASLAWIRSHQPPVATMTCDRCGVPLSTKREPVVFLPTGKHRCFPCWLR